MGVHDHAPEGEPEGSRKGKEKAPAPKLDPGSQLLDDAQAADASMMSRITTSAMALGSSLVARPDNPGRLLPADKAGPSISSFGHSRGGFADYKSQVASGSGHSMRSAQVQDHIEQEEAVFSRFLNGTDLSDPAPYPTGDGLGQVNKDTPLGTPSREPCTPRRREYADSDGLAVVQLLDSGYDEVAQPDPDVPLSAEDARSLREALFGRNANPDKRGTSPDWGDILNFVPQFAFTSNVSNWDPRDEAREYLGTSDLTEAMQIWADQWWDVLSRYTDEVWGDLGSLAQEAKEEIRKIRQSGGEASPAETKAIQRLRQILSHIRGG